MSAEHLRATFVSDLHLKTMEERNSQTLLRFLRSWHEGVDRPTHLFLVGDIFDLWIGKHEFFIERFRPIVDALRSLVIQGVEVHFFEGNHDLYLRPFWECELGVTVHEDRALFDLAGLKVRVEHGDLINPDDTGYLFLRAFLRTGAMKWLSGRLPASVVSAIGEHASRASREYTSTAKELPKDEIRRLIREHARLVYMEAPFDLIVTGHVHVADDHSFEVGGKQVRSINLGSWYDGPKALTLSADGKPRLENLT